MGGVNCGLSGSLIRRNRVPTTIVIARKGEALTWQSPVTTPDVLCRNEQTYQEIATSLRSSQ